MSFGIDFEPMSVRNTTRKIFQVSNEHKMQKFNRNPVPMATVQLKQTQNPKKAITRKFSKESIRLNASQDFGRRSNLSDKNKGSLYSDMKNRLDIANLKINELENENAG